MRRQRKGAKSRRRNGLSTQNGEKLEGGGGGKARLKAKTPRATSGRLLTEGNKENEEVAKPWWLGLVVFSGMRWWGFPSWDSLFQSQRDCIHQPWVARNELPRVSGTEFKTLKGEWRLDKEKSKIHQQNHRFKGCDVAPSGANIN